MKVSLVGVQDMNFTSRDGNEINGVKVFIAYDCFLLGTL